MVRSFPASTPYASRSELTREPTPGLAGVAHSALGDAIYALPSSYFFATTLTGHFVGGLMNDACSDWVVKQTVERALDKELRGVLTTDGELASFSSLFC